MATARKARDWGQTLGDMVIGKRNPRVMVCELNGHLKHVTRWLTHGWQVSMTVPEPQRNEQGEIISHTWRKRRPDELPENDPNEWAKLADYARALRITAETLTTFAEEQQAAAEQRAKGAS